MSEPDAIDLSKFASTKKADRDGFKRLDVNEAQWTALAIGCAQGLQDFSSLWVDGSRVRMALISSDRKARAICTLKCAGNSYPSIGRFHPPALRLERAMADLYALKPEASIDDRPWLDHGVWPKPGSTDRAKNSGEPERRSNAPYTFLPVEGEGLHQIPVGPVHAGIIEPGHFRFTANGETVVRLEQRLGYVHKGIEALCVGKTVTEAARIVARVSGDSTVAYSFAYSQALEAACNIKVPTRARILRAIMAELERISHHVNDFGAICNDASVVAMNAHCTHLREQVVQLADRCFGHRFMMDKIVPGGVAADLSDDGARDIKSVLEICAQGLATAIQIYDNSPSIQNRTVTTGIVSLDRVLQFAAGGYVGRASGRNFDARRDIAYAPYDSLEFDVPVRDEGDVDARAWIRLEEVTQSILIIGQLLERLEPGPITAEFEPSASKEGAAMTEAFRGDVLVTVRLDDNGSIGHCHARDASWFQWPLLETAVEGNIVADFPLCNKSFNCSYSGHDI